MGDAVRAGGKSGGQDRHHGRGKRIGPSSGSTVTAGRWPRSRRPDEDWELVLVGALAVVVAVGLGLLVLASAHGRDARLADASATEQRLAAGGIDDTLANSLLTLQHDEVTLFQAYVDAAAQESPPGDDPNAAVQRVQRVLANAAGQLGDSARAHDDLTLITDELAYYQPLVATALADNQQGLPVGAAYLRDASGYLRYQMLAAADDIRATDQQRLTADDADAAGVPVGLLVAAVLAEACLLAAQVVLARRTRRRFNPGLLSAAIMVTVLAAWSVTAVLASRNQVATGAMPHATAATDLVSVQDDVTLAGLDDQLSQVDHGEDCTAQTDQITTNGKTTYDYPITCTYENDTLSYLAASVGKLPAEIQKTGIRKTDILPTDLARAITETPDAGVRDALAAPQATTARWLTDELALPTLENLAANPVRSQTAYPRYNGTYVNSLLPGYTNADTAGSLYHAVNTDSSSLKSAVADATGREWSAYTADAAGAGDTLGGLVTGGLLLGLFAGVAAGAGVGVRIAEYWSAGDGRT